MIRRVISSIYWAIAVDSSKEGLLERCLKYLDKYGNIRGDVPKALALTGICQMRIGDSDAARSSFEEVRQIIKKAESLSTSVQYIDLYSKYWLTVLDNEPDEEVLRMALSIAHAGAIKKILPLREGYYDAVDCLSVKIRDSSSDSF